MDPRTAQTFSNRNNPLPANQADYHDPTRLLSVRIKNFTNTKLKYVSELRRTNNKNIERLQAYLKNDSSIIFKLSKETTDYETEAAKIIENLNYDKEFILKDYKFTPVNYISEKAKLTDRLNGKFGDLDKAIKQLQNNRTPSSEPQINTTSDSRTYSNNSSSSQVISTENDGKRLRSYDE